MKTKIFLFLSFFVISYSCYKEDPIKPSVENENFVNIESLKNQGTNIYQQRLLDYFDKYKVLTMYQFNPTLFSYEIVGTPPYSYNPAKEANVGALLDAIDELFYTQIGEKAISKYTPLNILLVSGLQRSDGDYVLADCYCGLFCITFSGADEQIETWDKERKKQYKDNTTYGFTFRMYDRGLIGEPVDFLSVSDYLNSSVTINNYKELGFINFDPRFGVNPEKDFQDYLFMALSTTTEELNATGGLFDPAVDKKGLIRIKYDLIVKFYKEHDIDLVKIANYKVK